ncbi:carbohydrate ABC transporter membrane protein 1 (CUT1 family) [Scopulibacillus darangshiensis]|uniref:Carbohydrate ABC transporter membrane protein 1 (CUT1 family) n=1 Tax=Scopulibacillus darangshiensis TaxID=442528 RepID=A0A4R2P9D3_9BACL|nr:sugar ABC transporter permease [Scopulibacillus darangshiensis]TCP30948.1 carbohydrate ABC transporter membrane protein 1 (CUT1 family) [Scopulibacillus darangshiensis]
MKNKLFKYILLIPALVLIASTTIYPLMRSFWISLHDWDLKESLTIGPFVGIDNYVRAFSDSQFWNSILVTLIFTVSTVLITLALSIAVALLLSKEKRHLSFLRAVLIIPFAMSPALVGYSWRFMLNPDYGLFDKIIGFFIPPLADIVWLGTPQTAMIALVSVVVWIWLPFMSLMFISGLMGVPREVFEAAQVDGASSFQTLFRITIPMLRPIILIASILMVMFTLKAFDPIVTLTQGGPGDSTEVLNFFIYKTGFRFFDMGYSSALGYILAMITVGFVIIYMRRLAKGDDWN